MNIVQDGQYVFVYSAQRGSDINYHTPGWEQDSIDFGRTLYGALEAEGAEQIRLLQSLGSVPYTFMYQKGKGAMGEAIGDNQEAQTQVSVDLRENWEDGSYTTPPVGPVTGVERNADSLQSGYIEELDSCYFQVMGQMADGQWDMFG